jgi:hypothetical protein
MVRERRDENEKRTFSSEDELSAELALVAGISTHGETALCDVEGSD